MVVTYTATNRSSLRRSDSSYLSRNVPDGRISPLSIGISIVVLVTVTTLSRINRIAGPRKK